MQYCDPPVRFKYVSQDTIDENAVNWTGMTPWLKVKLTP